MSVEERHKILLQILQNKKNVTIHELKSSLEVSEPTIRNDLRFLESQGKLQRTHGGAIPSVRQDEIPYSERSGVRYNEKERIGKAAAEWINPGETVFLDAGSTIMALAKQLPDNLAFNAVTAALHIAMEADKRRDVFVHLIGGMLQSSLQEVVGPKAVQSIKEIRAHKVFLSISGLDLHTGATENHVLSAEVKKAMVEASEQVIVLADSDKMGKVCFADIIPLERIDTLITDEGLKPEYRQALAAKGVRVVIA
ncbi:DeoR/GlpR family DNA-binding transcription regulator [Cohnella soli]|uniref:DeoR/GlpR family DNA-binding transcription regulator n=1 Tax=Cohnella soli TaxID=425005 RepID=A0ABW0HV20_9BACL